MEYNETASNTEDVVQVQEALEASGKSPKARIYLIPRDPVSLPVEEGRSNEGFLDEIPLITPYAKSRLSRQLNNVRKGRSAVLTTPLLREGESLREFADECLSFIERELGDRFPELLELERSNAKKCSPTSVMLPYKDREHQLDQYFDDPGGDVTDEELDWATDLVVKYINAPGRGRLRPLSIEAACERLPKDTQWALPYFVHGCERFTEEEEAAFAANEGLPVEEVICFWDHRAAYLELAKAMANDPAHPGWNDPCCLGWRGDFGVPGKDNEPGTKQRIVWMYPHAISILESMYYPVLTDHLRSLPGFAAWRPESETRQVIHRALVELNDDELLWAFDASAFDQRLSGKLVRKVSRNIVQPMFQEGTRNLLDQLSEFSLRCGMVTPFGLRTGRDFNRPSGSGGTNLLDCLENLTMFAVVARRAGYSEEFILQTFKEVMGDDAVYKVAGDWAKLPVAETYAAAFGAVVNSDKENLSSKFTTYLKRVYTRELEGAASFERIALKMATYERPTPKGWSQYMTENRWIDQLGNLSTSPLFTKAIEWTITRAPLGLGTTLEGGVDELLSRASQIAWEEAGKTVDQLLNVSDKSLDAELGLENTKSGRELVIEYLRSRAPSAEPAVL